jgi:hypothetical protein
MTSPPIGQPDAFNSKNSSDETEKSKDEIFVMLFCRSVIQSAFMWKAQSFPATSWRDARPDGTAGAHGGWIWFALG